LRGASEGAPAAESPTLAGERHRHSAARANEAPSAAPRRGASPRRAAGTWTTAQIRGSGTPWAPVSSKIARAGEGPGRGEPGRVLIVGGTSTLGGCREGGGLGRAARLARHRPKAAAKGPNRTATQLPGAAGHDGGEAAVRARLSDPFPGAIKEWGRTGLGKAPHAALPPAAARAREGQLCRRGPVEPAPRSDAEQLQPKPMVCGRHRVAGARWRRRSHSGRVPGPGCAQTGPRCSSREVCKVGPAPPGGGHLPGSGLFWIRRSRVV